MVEGTRETEVVYPTPVKGAIRPRTVTIKIKERPPFIITVQKLYPDYFAEKKKLHAKRISRLKKARRKGEI